MVPVSTSPLPLLMPLVLLSSALRHRLQMRLKDSLLFSFSSRRASIGFGGSARPVTSVNATGLGPAAGRRDENPSNRLIFVSKCQQKSGIPCKQ
jgi:hypothetical protein